MNTIKILGHPLTEKQIKEASDRKHVTYDPEHYTVYLDAYNRATKFLQIYCIPQINQPVPALCTLYLDYYKLRHSFGIDIKKALVEMPYRDFLSTPYWYIIATTLKQRTPVCHLCGYTEIMHVHHTTYAHHGEEILHLEDLVVVCESCHKELHNPENSDYVPYWKE